METIGRPTDRQQQRNMPSLLQRRGGGEIKKKFLVHVQIKYKGYEFTSSFIFTVFTHESDRINYLFTCLHYFKIYKTTNQFSTQISKPNSKMYGCIDLSFVNQNFKCIQTIPYCLVLLLMTHSQPFCHVVWEKICEVLFCIDLEPDNKVMQQKISIRIINQC